MLQLTTEIDWQPRKREVLVYNDTTHVIEFNSSFIIILCIINILYVT